MNVWWLCWKGPLELLSAKNELSFGNSDSWCITQWRHRRDTSQRGLCARTRSSRQLKLDVFVLVMVLLVTELRTVIGNGSLSH